MDRPNKYPKSWKIEKLSNICELQAGKFISASEISATNNDHFYPCYGGNGIRGYVKEFSHNGTYPLIGRQGALCGNINKVSGKFYATEHAVVAKPNSDINVNWLTYQLIFTDLNRYATGAAQPGLSVKNINKIFFPVPSIAEQKAIADYLLIWDKAIEKNERMIQAKAKLFKAYCQKIINHKCDSWTHIKPKKIFDTITEKNFPDEELLSVTQDRGVIPRRMLEGRVMSPGGTTSSYKLIKQGDFAISLRSFQGGIEYSNYRGIISPAYTVLRPKIEINCEFFRIFFKTYIFIEKYLKQAVIGIRDGKQISIPDFMRIKIPVPPVKEQERIAELLNSVQIKISLLKQLGEKYKAQKRGLMQKLLTGRWRVNPEIINKYKEDNV